MLKRLFPPPTREQVIALGGVFLACRLVDACARLGRADNEGFETAIYSLLERNPESTEAVYRSSASLADGFETLTQVLSDPKEPGNAAILRYAIGVIHIAGKVSGDPKRLNAIAKGIDGAARQAQHFSITHENVIANLADLYQNTISTLRFRIQVRGVADYLQQPAVASRIRCLLFSGTRSAILWKQLRGGRLHFLIHRKAVLAIAGELRREAAARATMQ